MTKVVLDQAQVVAAIGERETAGMAQHVGMDMTETGPFSSHGEDIVDGLPGKRLPPFRDEQPRQKIVTLAEPASDRP